MDLTTVTSLRRPATRDALALAPGETFLAGGTWLFSEPQPDVSGLVDLTALGWPAWEAGDVLTVAATCTITELLEVPADVLGGAHDLVRRCAEAFLMSFKVWQAATVGGNVCLALPAGAMTSLLAGLDATVVVWTPDGGERRELVSSFVTGVRATRLAPGEVVRAFEVPASSLAARSAFRKIALTPIGRSSSVVVARVDAGGTTAITVTAATSRPVVLRFDAPPPVEEALVALGAVDCWYDDPHGPADWREGVTGVLVGEVLAELAS